MRVSFEQGAYGNGIYCPAANGNGGRNSQGTEQRLSRALFKIAVELGAVTHMLAAVHEIDDDTMIKLRAMCIDEVKRINGVINFEKAVRYQRLD